MTKTRKFWAGMACVHALLLPSLPAQAADPEQYIADDISVTIRQKPSNEAESLGVIHSGARVSVLESLGADSFAHIRTADGRDGWINARFLSEQPAAKDQLQQLRQQLEQARGETQSLQEQLEAAQQQLAKAAPALQMAEENDKLRNAMSQREQQVGALEQQFDAEDARRRTLITGAGMVGAGVLIGLLLPWLGRRKKRRDGF